MSLDSTFCGRLQEYAAALPRWAETRLERWCEQ
jgi:hypothetical protein